MKVNKGLAVRVLTGICALIYVHPSKYGMAHSNFLSTKQFLIAYSILELFTLERKNSGRCIACFTDLSFEGAV